MIIHPMQTTYFFFAGTAVVVLSVAMFRNPTFYQRSMKFGSPEGTDVRIAALLGASLGAVMLAASVASALGWLPAFL